ncbi:MAG: SDR family oxidoreductase, partial [Alphaproteobacteria bacterium]|nr:SDR family oxidoreductase [Alphaproteobacteria bacterium]
GVDHVYPSYDYVACTKAVLEERCRALAERLPGARVNAVRTRLVVTEGLEEVFGPDLVRVMAAFPELHLAAEEVADAVLALCGDELPLTGQVLRVDRGAHAVDNLAARGPELVARLAGAPPPPRTPPEPTELEVELVGDGSWVPELRRSLAEAGWTERPGAWAVVASAAGDEDPAGRVWPVVDAMKAHPRRAAVLVHEGGSVGALGRTLVRHLAAHEPSVRINAVRAGAPRETALAVRTLLGPALRAVRGQQLCVGVA